VDHSGLIDKKHSDSALVVGTNQIHVHRALISCRFESLLAGLQPKKNKKGGFDYDFKDVDYAILNHVVYWIYSGTRKPSNTVRTRPFERACDRLRSFWKHTSNPCLSFRIMLLTFHCPFSSNNLAISACCALQSV